MWVWGSAKGFDLKLFQQKVSNERADGENLWDTSYLYIFHVGVPSLHPHITPNKSCTPLIPLIPIHPYSPHSPISVVPSLVITLYLYLLSLTFSLRPDEVATI